MEETLISVIIPVYKAEKYLNQCVNSIVKQTYRNLEIILVDDGSPDGSSQLCDDWAKQDPRIQVIHKVNEGAGIARNVGLSRATGDYVCFFDSDDFLAEDALEKTYRTAKTENADLVIFGAYYVNADGQVTKVLIPHAEKTVFTGAEVQRVFLPDLIENGCNRANVTGLCMSFWVHLFSMDLIRRSNWQIVSERDYASEDSYSLLSLYRSVNKVAVLPEALYYYRIVAGSLSRTYKQDAFINMGKFYQSCMLLSERQDYSEEVRKRIAGLFFSQVIGIFKQIVLTDLPAKQKKAIFRELVTDQVLQDALAKIDWNYTSKKKQHLLNCMRRGFCRGVYGLILLQQYTIILRK